MNILESAHKDMVTSLAKPGEDILNELTEEKWGTLLHAMGSFIAASDYLDKVKKMVVYNKATEDFYEIPQELPAHLTPSQMSMIHMAIGIAGEASEILSAVYNMIFNGELDKENATEELGDLEFYMEGFRQDAKIKRMTSLEHNMEKLVTGSNPRYAGGTYSDEKAQTRADKFGENDG